MFFNGLKPEMKEVIRMKEPVSLTNHKLAVLKMQSATFCKVISSASGGNCHRKQQTLIQLALWLELLEKIQELMLALIKKYISSEEYTESATAVLGHGARSNEKIKHMRQMQSSLVSGTQEGMSKQNVKSLDSD